jgi:hypothetical protein
MDHSSFWECWSSRNAAEWLLDGISFVVLGVRVTQSCIIWVLSRMGRSFCQEQVKSSYVMKGVCYAYMYVFWSEVYVGCFVVITPRPNVQNYLPDVALGAPLCCFKISCFLKLNISYYVVACGCNIFILSIAGFYG